jgi:uncharacterized protein (DUF1697 family)
MAANINYVDQIVAALAEWLDDCEVDLLRQYALLVLVTGEQTTEQDAHDAWAAWRTATNPRHRLLVPFDRQTAEEQVLNTPYADAIRAVAARLREPDKHCSGGPRRWCEPARTNPDPDVGGKSVGATGTARNWATVTKLLAMCDT